MPLELAQRLDGGSKRSQKQAATDLAKLWAGLASGQSTSSLGKKAKAYGDLLLALTPPQRSVVAGQVARVFGPSLNRLLDDSSAKDKLDFFLQRLASTQNPQARERMTLAMETGNFPDGAAKGAIWQIWRASTHPGANDPALWSRYVNLVLEHFRLYGDEHQTWSGEFFPEFDVTPQVCRTYEVINALFPMTIDPREPGFQQVLEVLDKTYWAMASSSHPPEASREATVEAGMDILKTLSSISPTLDNFDDRYALQSRTSMLHKLLNQKSPETILSIRDGIRSLLSFHWPSDLTAYGRSKWADVFFKLLCDLPEGATVQTTLDLMREALRLTNDPEIKDFLNVAFVDPASPLFGALSLLATRPIADFEPIFRVALFLLQVEVAASSGTSFQTRYGSILTSEIRHLAAMPIESVKKVSEILGPTVDARAFTERNHFAVATCAESNGVADSIKRLCASPLSHLNSLSNFLREDLSEMLAQGNPDSSRLLAPMLPLFLNACYAMNDRERLAWTIDLLTHHRQLVESGIFSQDWSLVNQLRLAAISRELPAAERQPAWERLSTFAGLRDFDSQRVVDILASLPRAEISSVLDLALRTPTQSATVFLDHLNAIARTPDAARYAHSQQLFAQLLAQRQRNEARRASPRILELNEVMAAGQHENVMSSDWHERIRVALTSINRRFVGEIDIDKEMKNIEAEIARLAKQQSESVLNRRRAGRTELKNAIFALSGTTRARDFSGPLDKNGPIREILAVVWHAIDRYDCEQLSSPLHRRGLSGVDMRLRTRQDKDNMRHNLVMSIAACVEDDDHRVCAVGQQSRFVRVLQGYYPEVIIDQESEVSPGPLLNLLAEQFNRAHGDTPSPAAVRQFITEARASARDVLRTEAAIQDFYGQLEEYLRMQNIGEGT